MADDRWHERSIECDWEAAAFVGHPGQRAAGELLAMASCWPHGQLLTGVGLQWVEMGCASLAAWRRIGDQWRGLVRDQQDAFLLGLRDQLHRAQARTETQQIGESERHVSGIA